MAPFQDMDEDGVAIIVKTISSATTREFTRVAENHRPLFDSKWLIRDFYAQPPESASISWPVISRIGNADVVSGIGNADVVPQAGNDSSQRRYNPGTSSLLPR